MASDEKSKPQTQCRHCGRKLSFFKRFSNQEFCSASHRTEFFRSHEEMALERLSQWANAALEEQQFEAEEIEETSAAPVDGEILTALTPVPASYYREEASKPETQAVAKLDLVEMANRAFRPYLKPKLDPWTGPDYVAQPMFAPGDVSPRLDAEPVWEPEELIVRIMMPHSILAERDWAPQQPEGQLEFVFDKPSFWGNPIRPVFEKPQAERFLATPQIKEVGMAADEWDKAASALLRRARRDWSPLEAALLPLDWQASPLPLAESRPVPVWEPVSPPATGPELFRFQGRLAGGLIPDSPVSGDTRQRYLAPVPMPQSGALEIEFGFRDRPLPLFEPRAQPMGDPLVLQMLRVPLAGLMAVETVPVVWLGDLHVPEGNLETEVSKPSRPAMRTNSTRSTIAPLPVPVADQNLELIPALLQRKLDPWLDPQPLAFESGARI